MSPQKRRPQVRKGRTASAAGKRGRTDRTSWIIGGVVVAIGIVLVIAFAASSTKKRNTADDDGPAPAALVAKVTDLPESVISSVGQGNATLPKKLPGPVLLKDGKPRIVYIGAEYCPYCAAERWAMVNALARFGTFSGLRTATSAGPPEGFPNTKTFSFWKSKFTSDYIVFEPVELETRERDPLETPTADQSKLEKKWNVPPYATGSGSIPFIDIADSFLVSGAGFDTGVLTDKDVNEIADAMNDATSDVAQGVVGAANALTAAICSATDDKPAGVCKVPAIQTIKSALEAQT